jgi:hypothetical protein
MTLLPVFFALIGLLEFRAYKSELASNPGQFDPLTLHLWENETKRRPRLLNKRDPVVYFPLLLLPLRRFKWVRDEGSGGLDGQL